MGIDPVIVLVEELRSAEISLRSAVKEYERNHCREHGEALNLWLATIKSLNRELAETTPTSAMGAAELIHLVIERLPFSHARYANHFSEIAKRLSAGERTHADLVWLRAMQIAIASSAHGEFDFKAAPLLHSAIFGAARPVVVFRAVMTPGAIANNGAMGHWPTP